MLPYLTSSERETRLRAIDVIEARYPVEQVPVGLRQLIVNTLVLEAASPELSLESRKLLADAAQRLEQVKQPDPKLSAALNKLPSRVYLHIAEESQRALARNW